MATIIDMFKNGLENEDCVECWLALLSGYVGGENHFPPFHTARE